MQCARFMQVNILMIFRWVRE